MEDLKSYVINEMIEHLKDMENIKIYSCDLGYKIFEYENINGSYTCSKYQSIEWIKKYFDELVEVVDEINFNCGKEFLPNVFDEPEKFQLICMLEISSYLMSQCEFVYKNWDNEIALDKKTIDIICEELKKQDDGKEIFS